MTEKDVNDPRFVWYCSKCSKNMKKMASSGGKPSKPKHSPPQLTKDSSTSNSVPMSKSSSSKAPSDALFSFKRAEVTKVMNLLQMIVQFNDYKHGVVCMLMKRFHVM